MNDLNLFLKMLVNNVLGSVRMFENHYKINSWSMSWQALVKLLRLQSRISITTEPSNSSVICAKRETLQCYSLRR